MEVISRHVFLFYHEGRYFRKILIKIMKCMNVCSYFVFTWSHVFVCINFLFFLCRILVLDAGLIKEFDTPSNLLADSTGVFYSLAKDAGLVGR
jgi:hypothetical protein